MFNSPNLDKPSESRKNLTCPDFCKRLAEEHREQLTLVETSQGRAIHSMKRERGFSLIELLIVVAIILIIAAIAVPNLLRARMSANESSAGYSARTLSTANVTYSTTYGLGFAGSIANLGPDTAAPGVATSSRADLVDSVISLATATGAPKAGYYFTYTAGPGGPTPTTSSQNLRFSVLAIPVQPGSTGTSTFCGDQTNVIRKDPIGSTAGPDATGCNTYSGSPI